MERSIIAVVVLSDEESHNEFIAAALMNGVCPQLTLIQHIMARRRSKCTREPLAKSGLDVERQATSDRRRGLYRHVSRRERRR
jgi:hypothetical protein